MLTELEEENNGPDVDTWLGLTHRGWYFSVMYRWYDIYTDQGPKNEG